MAIRALGELKDVSSLATVERFLRSPNPLLADYAKSARAAIKGEAYTRPKPREDALRGDLACLPSGLGVVGRVNSDSSGPLDFAKLLAPESLPEGMDKATMELQIVGGIGEVMSKVGNFRIQAITFGVSTAIGDDEGFVVAIVRGLYSKSALDTLLGDRIGGVRMKAGGMVYHELESDNFYIAPVSNELLVIAAGPSRDAIPLEEVATKVIAGGGDFALGKDLAKMLDRTETAAPLWALMKSPSPTGRRRSSPPLTHWH